MARINSRQVEAFRAMMLTGSVTEAARLMAVTQPAASRLLRDLQSLLKMELFERRGTGLVPTAAATALYTEVARSFVGLERIAAAAEEIRGRRTGTLRVAAMPALANGYLPRLAGHFLKERPNLNLAFFGVISPIVVDWVMNNQCDVGFAEVPIAHSGLPNQRLPALPRVAILPAGHHLEAKEVIEPRDFEGETFVSLSAGSTSRHLIDQVSTAAMYAVCSESRPIYPRSCAEWCHRGSGSAFATLSPRRNSRRAASSCAPSRRGLSSNSLPFFPYNAALHPWP